MYLVTFLDCNSEYKDNKCLCNSTNSWSHSLWSRTNVTSAAAAHLNAGAQKALQHLQNVNTLWVLQKAKLLCGTTPVTDRPWLCPKTHEIAWHDTYRLVRGTTLALNDLGEKDRAGVMERGRRRKTDRERKRHGDGAETRTERWSEEGEHGRLLRGWQNENTP